MNNKISNLAYILIFSMIINTIYLPISVEAKENYESDFNISSELSKEKISVNEEVEIKYHVEAKKIPASEIKPKDIIIVLDASYDMRENNNINKAKESATKFIDDLANAGVDARVGFIQYSRIAKAYNGTSGFFVDISKETDRENLKNEINNNYQPIATTNTGDALRLAYNKFNQNKSPNREQVLILLSNGQPTVFSARIENERSFGRFDLSYVEDDYEYSDLDVRKILPNPSGYHKRHNGSGYGLVFYHYPSSNPDAEPNINKWTEYYLKKAVTSDSYYSPAKYMNLWIRKIKEDSNVKPYYIGFTPALGNRLQSELEEVYGSAEVNDVNKKLYTYANDGSALLKAYDDIFTNILGEQELSAKFDFELSFDDAIEVKNLGEFSSTENLANGNLKITLPDLEYKKQGEYYVAAPFDISLRISASEEGVYTIKNAVSMYYGEEKTTKVINNEIEVGDKTPDPPEPGDIGISHGPISDPNFVGYNISVDYTINKSNNKKQNVVFVTNCDNEGNGQSIVNKFKEKFKDSPNIKLESVSGDNIGDGLRLAYNILKNADPSYEKHIVYIGNGRSDSYDQSRSAENIWLHSLDYSDWNYARKYGNISDPNISGISTEAQWYEYYQSRGRMYADKCMAYSSRKTFSINKRYYSSWYGWMDNWVQDVSHYNLGWFYFGDGSAPTYYYVLGEDKIANIDKQDIYTQMWVNKIKDSDILPHYLETRSSFEGFSASAIPVGTALSSNSGLTELDLAIANIYGFRDRENYYLDQFKAANSMLFRSNDNEKIEEYIDGLIGASGGPASDMKLLITEQEGLEVAKVLAEDKSQLPIKTIENASNKIKEISLKDNMKFTVIYKSTRPDRYDVDAEILYKEKNKAKKKGFITKDILVRPINEPTILMSQMPTMAKKKSDTKFMMEDNGSQGVVFKDASFKLPLKNIDGEETNLMDKLDGDFSIRLKVNPFELVDGSKIFETDNFKIGLDSAGRVKVTINDVKDYAFGNDKYKLEKNSLNEVFISYTKDGDLYVYINGIRFKRARVNKSGVELEAPINPGASPKLGGFKGLISELSVSDSSFKYANGIEDFIKKANSDMDTSIVKWEAKDFSLASDSEDKVLVFEEEDFQLSLEYSDKNVPYDLSGHANFEVYNKDGVENFEGEVIPVPSGGTGKVQINVWQHLVVDNGDGEKAFYSKPIKRIANIIMQFLDYDML